MPSFLILVVDLIISFFFSVLFEPFMRKKQKMMEELQHAAGGEGGEDGDEVQPDGPAAESARRRTGCG